MQFDGNYFCVCRDAISIVSCDAQLINESSVLDCVQQERKWPENEILNMFLFGEVSSSSGCLGWATLFYCGTP